MTKIIIAAIATFGFIGAAAAETPRYITNPDKYAAQMESMRGSAQLDQLLTGSIDRTETGSVGRTVQPGMFWADPDVGYNYYGR